MIISISGAHGSGKSTLAKELAKKLGWPRYYMGGISRETAAKKGMTLAEFNTLSENNPEIDKELDEYQRELGKNQDNFIIEGYTSWHFIPHSLKIYLDADREVAAKRIWEDISQNGARENEDKNINSWRDISASISKRVQNEINRYRGFYNIDVHDKNHYDYYLDTTSLTPETAFEKVYAFIKSHIDKS